MREEFGDLWELAQRPNSVACITTNGVVNARGECVMGRGVARQARDRFPGLAKLIGGLVTNGGNRVHWVGQAKVDGVYLATFPTKYDWRRPSNLMLIQQSAEDLKKLAGFMFPNFTFYLPRPGCSSGGLKWEDVRPVLEWVGLPDNVVVVDRAP